MGFAEEARSSVGVEESGGLLGVDDCLKCVLRDTGIAVTSLEYVVERWEVVAADNLANNLLEFGIGHLGSVISCSQEVTDSVAVCIGRGSNGGSGCWWMVRSAYR